MTTRRAKDYVTATATGHHASENVNAEDYVTVTVTGHHVSENEKVRPFVRRNVF